jgi:oxygen-independent coproporphyrinogen-3 oxidase
MYRQKNSAGNLENVGFCKKGTECIYNILMMEEVHTIFAVGAGAVTKLTKNNKKMIKRVFNPKYPYEYLAQDREEEFKKLTETTSSFFDI